MVFEFDVENYYILHIKPHLPCTMYIKNNWIYSDFSQIMTSFDYTYILFQIGHEPLDPSLTGTWFGFGKQQYIYPNIFKYSKFYELLYDSICYTQNLASNYHEVN